MDQIDMEILALASLLHDIGKFAQRAKRPKSVNMEGEYCPAYKGRPSHAHVLYTDNFIEKDLLLPPELVPSRSRIARLASAHHKPAGSDLLELAIAQADRLSAGMDRVPQEDDAGDYMNARLLSSFSQIKLSESGDETPRQYYRLRSIEEDPFPVNLETAQASSYAELFRAFITGLGNIPLDMGVRPYLASLVSLLERYTWCIPSSTYRTEPDISLYDHAVTTAAIAQALAMYHEQQGGLPGSDDRRQPKFLLVGGDLSGIQSYIFDIEKSHGAGVAKLLRARSFHLQALTQSVILTLLERTNLLPQAKIMDAGGRFVLLLPAVPKVEELLPQFEAEVQEWFLKEFKGRLSLNMSHSVRMDETDFALSAFHKRLDEFFDCLELQKMRKFASLLEGGRPPIAVLAGEDFTAGACEICRTNPVSENASARYENQTGKSAKLCEQCEGQIERIGRRLPQAGAKFALFSRMGNMDSIPLFGGMALHFAEVADKRHKGALDIVNLRTRGQFSYHAIAGHLPRFASGDDARWETEGRKASLEEFVIPDTPKTFSQIAQEARIPDGQGRLRGKAFLGALKADLDNLGMIFSVGFGDKLSLSRFAGLSRMLNHFFAEVMLDLIGKNPLFHDIYVVFAGGDDLFLIGPWHQLMTFSETLAGAFRRYVAGNRDVTLSAGIFITKPTLPANTVARNASALLDESKKYQHSGEEGKTKNAVTVLGVTIGWEEYSALMQRGTWLERLVLEGHIPSGLAMRLMRYADDCLAFRSGKGGRRSGMYRSQMRYDFARNLNNKSLTQRDKEELEALGTDPLTLERMRLPISYALYRMRTE
ncbi:type III-A CRISPR-associated protein Cas10/Csm1 [Paucidesulfovibrio longus]|uniref:type III-A CRISPR-associated protein Cas10/Csm1 n=1 Tax=Paucidesulfovibrio longus TaxID=889 RepID=UPI0003B6833C|nr:type III-A CRISPR-associated protein Cas10/Csm1 [Paucidesulfovibrio longus]